MALIFQLPKKVPETKDTPIAEEVKIEITTEPVKEEITVDVITPPKKRTRKHKTQAIESVTTDAKEEVNSTIMEDEFPILPLSQEEFNDLKEKATKKKEFDENKLTSQLIKENPISNEDYIVAIDRFFDNVKYKVNLRDIKYLYAIIYIADLTLLPHTILAKRYLVAHKGQHVVDELTEDVFESLLGKYDVSYTYVDVLDPLGTEDASNSITGRRNTYSYASSNGLPPSIDEVMKSRDKRQKIVIDKKKEEEEMNYQVTKYKNKIKAKELKNSEEKVIEEPTIIEDINESIQEE